MFSISFLYYMLIELSERNPPTPKKRNRMGISDGLIELHSIVKVFYAFYLHFSSYFFSYFILHADIVSHIVTWYVLRSPSIMRWSLDGCKATQVQRYWLCSIEHPRTSYLSFETGTGCVIKKSIHKKNPITTIVKGLFSLVIFYFYIELTISFWFFEYSSHIL